MKNYMELCKKVLEHGHEREDRTGTGTLSLFGEQLRFDLTKGFPAVTTKKLFWKGVVGELLWFLSGSVNVQDLRDRGVNFWNSWEREDGTIGLGYGHQFRMLNDSDGNPVDQVLAVIDSIENNPQSRRHMISLWNVQEIHKMELPPCHGNIIQFYVNDDKLSVSLYQRSCDLFLGCPVNLASYALFTYMVAQVCDLEVGEMIYNFGDVHIYKNHIKQMKEQLARSTFPLPELWLNPEITDIDDFTIDDVKMVGYKSHAVIKGEVSV